MKWCRVRQNGPFGRSRHPFPSSSASSWPPRTGPGGGCRAPSSPVWPPLPAGRGLWAACEGFGPFGTLAVSRGLRGPPGPLGGPRGLQGIGSGASPALAWQTLKYQHFQATTRGGLASGPESDAQKTPIMFRVTNNSVSHSKGERSPRRGSCPSTWRCSSRSTNSLGLHRSPGTLEKGGYGLSRSGWEFRFRV